MDREFELMQMKMEQYSKRFKDNYPLYRESDIQKVIYYIDECLREDKPLEELFPEEFGPLDPDISI